MARPQIPLNSWGDVKIKKNASGSWTARGTYRDYTGEKHDWTASGKTKYEADHALRLKAERFIPASIGQFSATMSCDELFVAWIDHKRTVEKLQESGAHDYEQVWRIHLRDRFGRLTLREVTTGSIQQHITKLTPSNARRARVVLNGMFDLAERMDVVTRNPAKATKFYRPDTKPIKALTASQIAAVREALDRHDKTRRGPKSFLMVDYFDLMIGTGLRPGELLALQWSDVNFNGRDGKVWISVRGTQHHRDGKQRGPLVKSETTKTKASARDLPVPDYVADILRRLHKERRFTTSNAVLTTSTGNFVSLNNVNRTLRKIRTELDLSWMTSHSFRKTAATHVTAKNGAEKAARLLGHADPSITRQYYIDPEQMDYDATETLEQLGPDGKPHLRVVGEEGTGEETA